MAVDIWGRGGPDGDSFGQSGKTMSFFGAAAVAQPSGQAQAAVTRGAAGGTIATYLTLQSPSSILTITTTEKGLTVQTGTGFQMQLATADLIYVNKPTAQAGLGMGNVRVSAANVAGVTFSNPTAATLTPTASQNYIIIALRGITPITATLTPAAVLANTTVEQLFTATGVRAGELVQVMKPAAQAGLDIVGVRVAANNQIGITFMNCTAATITPTASEAYIVWSLPGLDAANNFLSYSFNAGTVGAIGAGLVVTGGSTAVLGVLASDIPIGAAAKPTSQAAATNSAQPAFSILTADVIQMFFTGIGTGATPTASEVYTQLVYRHNPAAPLVLFSQSLAPVSVAANTCAEQTFTVTGLIVATAVWVNKPSAQAGLGIAGVRVSAANTLAINYSNTSGAAIVPTTETYLIGNFQTVVPGAGNCVFQSVSMADIAVKTLANGMRSGLVSLNLIAGA